METPMEKGEQIPTEKETGKDIPKNQIWKLTENITHLDRCRE
jgi:hypothetical protein